MRLYAYVVISAIAPFHILLSLCILLWCSLPFAGITDILLHSSFLLVEYMLLEGQDPMVSCILELPEIPCVHSVGKITASHLDYVSIV